MSASTTTEASAVVAAFNDAFNAHDLDRLAELLTEDCVFEDTVPPDGRLHEGRDQVLAAFATFFAASPSARFTDEGEYLAGDIVTVLWRYADGAGGRAGRVRGVDVSTVRSSRVAAKRSYGRANTRGRRPAGPKQGKDSADA